MTGSIIPQYNTATRASIPMAETTDKMKEPHWAWPHVVGVILAIAAYFVVYRYTGDADFLPALVAALAVGAGGVAATWAYIRFSVVPRLNDRSGADKSAPK